jgi:hypothetical protein
LEAEKRKYCDLSYSFAALESEKEEVSADYERSNSLIKQFRKQQQE